MIVFQFERDGSFGALSVTLNNVEKHAADFCARLDRGVILTSVTATVTAGASTISAAAMSNDRKLATWLFHAAAVAEQCTALVTVTTNDGQTLKSTITYSVG